MAARDRLLAYFLGHVGEVIHADTLRDVGRISEWARRVRELRTEFGYSILTHNDRSDLKPGEYILTSAKPQPAFARNISKEARALVLDRNGFTCQMCGAAAGEEHPYDGRRVRLHIGHIRDKSLGGTDEPSNLRALCSLCNEGTANVSLQRPDAIHLLTQVRRASTDDQRAVLDWLQQKFQSR